MPLTPVAESTSPLASATHLDKLTYDPTLVESDVFDMDNMVEGVDTKILTAAERALIATLPVPVDSSEEIIIASVNTTQTIPTATQTTVNMDTETLDLYSAMVAGVFTVPAALNGKLLAINAQVIWDNASTVGARNTTLIGTGSLAFLPIDGQTADLVAATVNHVDTIVKVATGDTLKLHAWQTSGGNLDITSSTAVERTYIRISVVG